MVFCCHLFTIYLTKIIQVKAPGYILFQISCSNNWATTWIFFFILPGSSIMVAKDMIGVLFIQICYSTTPWAKTVVLGAYKWFFKRSFCDPDSIIDHLPNPSPPDMSSPSFVCRNAERNPKIKSKPWWSGFRFGRQVSFISSFYDSVRFECLKRQSYVRFESNKRQNPVCRSTGEDI